MGRRRGLATLALAVNPFMRFLAEMSFLVAWMSSLRRDDEHGQGLAEYALILALIAVIAIAALVFLGTRISEILSTIGANI
jgi:pilus assembly protein Flp/PilA